MDPHADRHEPQPPSGNQSGCLNALMIVAGVILLLPGICSLFFIYGGMTSGLAALGLLVSAGGMALIVMGARGDFGRPPPSGGK
jgi:hypothetical protein